VVSLVSSYVIPPLTGLLVGLFGGLLQKQYVAADASACMFPDFLPQIRLDTPKLWAKLIPSAFLYILVHFLPFATAVLAAEFCSRETHCRGLESFAEALYVSTGLVISAGCDELHSSFCRSHARCFFEREWAQIWAQCGFANIGA
jgi:hypothetical protein